jgi:hypothetical protein
MTAPLLACQLATSLRIARRTLLLALLRFLSRVAPKLVLACASGLVLPGAAWRQFRYTSYLTVRASFPLFFSTVQFYRRGFFLRGSGSLPCPFEVVAGLAATNMFFFFFSFRVKLCNSSKYA